MGPSSGFIVSVGMINPFEGTMDLFDSFLLVLLLLVLVPVLVVLESVSQLIRLEVTMFPCASGLSSAIARTDVGIQSGNVENVD